MPKQKIVIRIPKSERVPKPRSGVKQSRVHKVKTGYQRSPKHPKRGSE